MAKQTTEDPNLDIGEVYSKTEVFIEKNKNTLLYAGIAFVLLVGAILFWNSRQTAKDTEGGNLIWKAEYWFEIDSLDLALRGNDEYYGFEYLADEYSSTPTGSLANFYLGSIYLKKGEYDLALTHYDESDPQDEVLSMMRLGGMGDANMELGNASEAAGLYEKAASSEDNEFFTPLYLFKAAVAHKESGNLAKAAELFNQVSDDYPNYQDAALAKKYAALYAG